MSVRIDFVSFCLQMLLRTGPVLLRFSFYILVIYGDCRQDGNETCGDDIGDVG